MAFIDKTDYGTAIKTNILDDITETDNNLLDIAESQAISFMKGYLNNRYDVVEIFNKTGANRHPVILKFAIDIAIYYLHNRINPRKTPKNRVKAYSDAKEWLEAVCELMINPPDLPAVTVGNRDYVQYGSNPKRTNHL
jgi:hypothetical protein